MSPAALERWLPYLPLLAAILSAIVAIIVVVVGALWTDRREERKRRFDWAEKQLREFYAPMWAIRQEIRTLDELKMEVGLEVVMRGGEVEPNVDIPNMTATLLDPTPPEKEFLNYAATQSVNLVQPAKKKLLEMFRDKMPYADLDTVGYFPLVVRWMETLQRRWDTNIPREITDSVDTKDEDLEPFYVHLEARMKDLKRAVETGKLPKPAKRHPILPKPPAPLP